MNDLEQITSDNMKMMPIEHIISREENPRKYFNDSTLKELSESIKKVGVVQPIVIRMTDDDRIYEILAGERRWRASKLAGLTVIPAVIRDVDDRTAFAMSTIENAQREDISPAEEARVAQSMMDLYEANKAEILKLLGWSANKLEARLLLLNAATEVIDALTQREILLGHAELLCNLPHVTQTGTLKKVIEDNVTVDALKAKIDAYALKLSDAFFNTTACGQCPMNTSSQGTLFENTVGDGRCLNRECWNMKREAAIAEKKGELSETYNVIYLDIEKTPENHQTLLKSEVGSQQLMACRGCANFGVVMSTAVGQEGTVNKDQCFNLTCLKKMTKAHAGDDSSKDAGTASSSTTNAKKADKKQPAISSKKTVAADPKKVLEYKESLHSTACVAVLDKTQRYASLLALAALINQCQSTSGSLVKEVFTSVKLDTGLSSSRSVNELIKTLIPLEDTTLKTLQLELSKNWLQHTATMLGAENANTVKVILEDSKPDLTEHFVVNRAFLETHTKSGIVVILQEAGFDTWFIAQYSDKEGTKKYKALLNEKRPDLIGQILNSEFDFTGFVPASLAYTK